MNSDKLYKVQEQDLDRLKEILTVCYQNEPLYSTLIDDEATLKHFFRHDDTVILQPENPRFTPMTYTKEEINELHIEGVAVGICRGLPEYTTEN